jgi:uncharacterized RDD family membrane protein YckC
LFPDRFSGDHRSMYYLWLKDAQAGPFSHEEVQGHLKARTIHSETLYWREGMAEWLPLHAIQHEIEGVSANMVVSGIWRRLAAFAVDVILLGFAGFFSGLFLFDFYLSLGSAGLFLGLIVATAYFGLLNSTMGSGQTLGKRLFSIRVVDAAGNGISPARSILRYLILSLPFWIGKAIMVGFFSGSFWFEMLASAISLLGFAGLAYFYLFNRQTRQSIHDLAIGTYVVRTTSPRDATAPTMWRGHLAALGALYFCLVIGGFGAGIILSRNLAFQRTYAMQQALVATGDIREVSLSEELSYVVAPDRPGTYSVTARWKKRPRSLETAADEVAAIVLKMDPSLAKATNMAVTISYGYDLGIAWGAVSQEFVHTPAEWKERLDLSH